MEQLIVLFIMIGVFNLLSRIMAKKLNKQNEVKDTADPNYPKTWSEEKTVNRDEQWMPPAGGDIFSELKKAAEMLMVQPEIKHVPLSKKKDTLSFKKQPVPQKEYTAPKREKEQQVPVIPISVPQEPSPAQFSPNPVLNGIIWSELLALPRSKKYH